ncbi:PREDICTED: protein fantom-like [Amphimedon queenslandica]|uniref:Uncharacterized protein n=1 Tax=Amphimedon queenslandica TaxID=400682 RepID=A0A1X7TFF5_AMPQE|nr:PREDICTED: protein fantom-like [Amphimedon queenslandica]|eukprot:XP_019859907.1 PREDICTED: protein fantom-like [Amphimedon queenslandica]
MSVVSEGCRIDPRTKRKITLMDRIDLEDKYIELYEENILLKKHAKGQEDKMKRLGTKLIKLSSDNKRTWREGEADELELKLHEVTGKLSKIETQNAHLRGKVSILKQQLALSWKRATPYGHVTSKTNSGLGRRKSLSFSTETLSYKSKTANTSTQVSPGGPLRYGHSLLEVARKDNVELEEIVLKLKEELTVLKTECDRLEENNRLQSVSHEEAILKLQEKIQIHINDKQRHILEEDVEKIRLQREVQSKSVSLQQATTNCQSLQKELTIMRNKCKSLTTDVTGLKTQLHEEQMISKDLLSKMKECSIEKRSLAELQDILTDVKYEKELLKQRNDRLTKSLLKSIGDTGSVTDDKHTGVSEWITSDMRTHYEQKLNETREETQRTIDELRKEKKLRLKLEEQILQLKDEHTLLKKVIENLHIHSEELSC